MLTPRFSKPRFSSGPLLVALTLAGLAMSACGGTEQAPNDDPDQGIDIARSELAYDADPTVSAEDAAALADGNLAFGLDLFQKVADVQPKDNVVVSPISATTALAMTYAGARGDTATEMATALRFTLPAERLHPAMNRLGITLAGRNIAKHTTEEGDKSLRLDLVNSLWAAQGYPFASEFLDGLAVNYDAGVRLLDFANQPDASRRTINDWVSAKTEDRIKDLLPPDAISSDTQLVLVNALYFYGSWQTPFPAENTAKRAFQAPGGEVQADTMFVSEGFSYGEGEGYQAIDLPYDGGKVSMRIVLPAEGAFDATRAAITPDWLRAVDASMGGTTVSLSLPKFSFTWGSTSLAPALKAMGMKKAFTGAADFSGMAEDGGLAIADVLQKAFIGVDEYGTEAAAATAVIMWDSAAPDQPVQLTVDRPFFFFIRDASGTVLFQGQVTDPTK